MILYKINKYIINNNSYDNYIKRQRSTNCIKSVFNGDRKTAADAWQNDEEFYTVTGFRFNEFEMQFEYNPINQNAFAHNAGLANREMYKNTEYDIPLERLSEFYKKIGFYEKELNIY